MTILWKFFWKKIRLIAVCFLLLSAVQAASAEKPSADFSGSPITGLPPLSVNFKDASSGSPAGYAWFFGDESYAGSWTRMTASAQWTKRLRPAVAVTPDGTIVLMGGHDDTGNRNDVWRSTDKGATWTLANASPGWIGRHAHAAVALADSSIIMTGGFNSNSKREVWISPDKGSTWSVLSADPGFTPRYYHTMTVLPDGSIVIAGGYGDMAGRMNDVWRSADGGMTWTQMTAGAEWSKRDSHTTVALPDGSLVLMGGFDNDYRNDVWRSEDNGTHWALVNASPGWSPRRMPVSVAMPDGTIVLTGGYDDAGRMSDVWISRDRGDTWTRAGGSPGWPKRSEHAMVVLPDASIVLLAGYDNVGSSLTEMVKNDTWRLQPAGSLVKNPQHTYAAEATYSVALQVYNADGYDSMLKSRYIRAGTAGGVIPLPPYTDPPTDPDEDGIYEDLNANGRPDFADIVLYYDYLDWIAAKEPLAAFDLNGNGRIDFADLVMLYDEV
ncbi:MULTISPECIES: kelch repeat-containing protein [unclassified Methanoregula]|uniref:Kelch repeat-containing protein n=1 Tax=unclassified Methanoregula TaxID=2649730 RepID=UPI0009C87FA7|nr:MULTISPECIES: kelch repeat-containing protein [unclassified Methanoregula]OPX65383.1 MAG: Kelch motif protein [Methanoregula sp. PtaB.Bin085]OPY32292.1 MAG: Kelch motif protein [Methanoregula sp. PtaU1.Bin006]